MPTLAEVGERMAIRKLLAVRPSASIAAASLEAAEGVVLEAGDDAAIVRPRAGMEIVVTTDAMVEDIHYRADWLEAAEAGVRLVEMNLSDLAAMSSAPRWALLTISTRPERTLEDLVAFQQGVVDALARAGAVLVGGNVAAAHGAEWASLTLIGEVERGRAWTRFGARPGDLVAITGHPGRAGAGSRLAQTIGAEARTPRFDPVLDAWLRPRARCGVALALGRAGVVTAAIDVSDGLAGDLAQLCEASGVGARLSEVGWPADPALDEAATALHVDRETLRFGPSDDYELLLAVDPARRADAERVARELDVPLHVVGAFTDAPVWLEWQRHDGTTRPLAEEPYDHFAGS